MNIRLVANYIGHILWIEGVFMVPALFIAIYKGEHSCVFAFIATIGALLLCGLALLLIKPRRKEIFAREGFVIVSVSWIIMSLFGALPFFISREIPHFMDCFFETVSGFTTTGASILSNVEALSMSLLYWRSFTHWLGGMGILVFVLAIVPHSKDSGDSLHILRAESPGPSVGKLVSKIRNTARILYTIYIVMTVIEVMLLLAGGMPLFDSINHAFATAGTGGFSIKNASLGAYDSYYLQTVISVFMLLFGINFNIFHLLLLCDYSKAFRNQELRLYLSIVGVSVILIALNIYHTMGSLRDAFHHSFFQVASIMTTTGFATADFNLWPEFSKMLLVLLMIIGACAGSTGGGIKVERLLILFKTLRNEIQKLIHPKSVKITKINGKVLDERTIHSVTVYMIAYILVSAVSILAVSVDNFSFTTSTTAVMACINNIGPGLDIVGPIGNYGGFSVFSKLVLSADMIIGRLEIFPVLLLFSPSLWRRCK